MGSFPGTPPDEVVSVLSLSSRETVTKQQLVFMGLDTLPGGFVETGSSNGVSLPGGGGLSPSAALWKPALEAGARHCATISLYGRNELAAVPTQSNTVCATVVAVDSPQLTIAAGAGGAGSLGAANGTSSGCAVISGDARAPSIGVLVIAALASLGARRVRRAHARSSPSNGRRG